MKKKNSIPSRIHPELKKLLEDTRRERLVLNKDKKPLSDTRLTLAMSRIPNIKDILIKSRISDEI